MRILTLLLMILLFFLSCKKEKEGEQVIDPPKEVTKGVLILNEGNWHMNNAGLTWYDGLENIAYQDYFTAKNERRLGELGNDALLYGSKIYIVLSGSHLIEVLDKVTHKSVAQIKLQEGNQGRTPRRMTTDNGFLYVSNFDGTLAVVDTIDFSIKKIIPIGKNPEGLAVLNNKLYVSNSGGLDFPNYDSTVSVIDLSSLTLIKTLTTGLNPSTVISGKDGLIYNLSRGNHKEIKPIIVRIDPVTDEVVDTLKFDFTRIEDGLDHLVVVNAPDEESVFEFYRFDYSTGMLTSSFKTSSMKTFFGLSVNPETGNYYCMDAMEYREPGKVFQFTPAGNEISVIPTGMLPMECLFINIKEE